MGTLYLVSTPIGNLEDVTIRAIRIILTVPVIACEDTRRTGLLIKHLSDSYAGMLGIQEQRDRRLLSYRNENEETVAYELTDLLMKGTDIALVTDAGTPLVSDPGFTIVRQAYKKHIPVTAVPGASSVLAAAVLSGFPLSKFTFVGYPPEKPGHRRSFFSRLLKSDVGTVIMFCAPHKLQTTLTDMLETIGNIKIVLLRELTKVHEERLEGSVSEILGRNDSIKGEVVVIFRLQDQTFSY